MPVEEPKIAPTVSFRPDYGPRDEVLGDQKHGFVEQEPAAERGDSPELHPPISDKAVPRTSLSERLRQRLEQRRP
jgi:hypothetical protein